MSRSPDWPAAVLFDFDGVIVDSEPIHFAAFQKVAAEEQIELTEQAYYRDLIGFDDRGGFGFLFEQHGKPLDTKNLARVMARKALVVREMLEAGDYQAMPGADRFVRTLARSRPLAICSGALRPEIESMLAGIKLSSCFRLIVSAEDVTRGKPDPEGYKLTLAKLSEAIERPLNPEDCLIVEDAPNVIRAVRAVGFPVLGVATSHSFEAIQEADYAVHSLKVDDLRRVLPELVADE